MSALTIGTGRTAVLVRTASMVLCIAGPDIGYLLMQRRGPFVGQRRLLLGGGSAFG